MDKVDISKKAGSLDLTKMGSRELILGYEHFYSLTQAEQNKEKTHYYIFLECLVVEFSLTIFECAKWNSKWLKQTCDQYSTLRHTFGALEEQMINLTPEPRAIKKVKVDNILSYSMDGAIEAARDAIWQDNCFLTALHALVCKRIGIDNEEDWETNHYMAYTEERDIIIKNIFKEV